MESVNNPPNRPSRWVEPFFVHSFDVDHTGKCTTVTLLKMMQEAAWRHAESLGLGFEHMKARNSLWVLSRLKVVVSRYPPWGEEFLLETWPSGMHRLHVTRDFRITDDEGVAAEATSSWIVLDLESRRPLRPETALVDHREMLAGELVLGETAGKVELEETVDPGEEIEWSRSRPFFVRVSALDSQSHVNNAKYLEWCLDAFSLDHYAQWELRELSVNFLLETHYDAELHVLTRELPPARPLRIPGAAVETMQAVQTVDGVFVFACHARWERRR